MNIRAHETAAIGLCAAAAPLTKPLVAESFARPPIASVMPKKPPGGGDAALNPQPIPPGHVGPGVPIR